MLSPRMTSAVPKGDRQWRPCKRCAVEYQQGRTALANLLTHKNVTWWLTWGRANLAAHQEAREVSGSDTGMGRRYNQAYKEIVKRERPFRVQTNDRPFPDTNSANDARAMAQNWEVVKHEKFQGYGKPITVWLDTLDTDERARLNHPTGILKHWKEACEPAADKQDRKRKRMLAAAARETKAEA